jgi:hypothetical protein
MKILPFALSFVRSFHEPVMPSTLSSRQAMPVVYIAYGTVCAEPPSYHGSSKNGKMPPAFLSFSRSSCSSMFALTSRFT